MSKTQPVLYVLSGAGLSAESGVPTFRSAGGIWDQHVLDRVCNAMTWKNHRSEVFQFYGDRRKEMGGVEPNDAHRRLAVWQQRWGTHRVKLLTQNVDDLLERAGAPEVIHLHGSLDKLQCTACGTFFPVAIEAYTEHTRCPKCDSLKGVKPAVVFFYENAPMYTHVAKMRHNIEDHDAMLVVGSSMQVVPLEQFMSPRRRESILNWQVNPEPVDVDAFAVNLATGAVQGLGELEEKVQQLFGSN